MVMNRLNLVTVIALAWLHAAAAVADDAPAAAATTDAVDTKASSLMRQPHGLNLRLPDITTFLSQNQIDTVLSRTADRDTLEEVQVEGSRLRHTVPDTPDIWPGIAAPVWAVLHPLQSWRIFGPIPPDRAQYIGSAVPDATDSFRPASLPDGIGPAF
jgi:hypothetical protein